MPRAGFLNNNEYRAYPFVHRTAYTGAALPDSAIVDAGMIAGLDSGFEPATHTVWLASIERTAGTFRFLFETDAPAAASRALVFVCSETAEAWSTITAESTPISVLCNRAPVWEGFLVVGALADLRAAIANNTTRTFPDNVRTLEPARVQSLVKSYVHSVNVGNYSRLAALPPETCPGGSETNDREIVISGLCMQGQLKLLEGFNCRIRQIDRNNEFEVAADTSSGDTDTTELCAHGGEVKLYNNEPFDPDTGFYSGGPACNQVIATVNGVGGGNINIVAGTGVSVTANAATNTITIALATNNLVGNCNT